MVSILKKQEFNSIFKKFFTQYEKIIQPLFLIKIIKLPPSFDLQQTAGALRENGEFFVIDAEAYRGSTQFMGNPK